MAKDVLDSPVAFELSITNVDKPALEESEVRNRLRQFTGYGPVVITHAPVFVQKARLLPGCTFVIGADTALRLVEARYYGDRSDRMLDALAEMRLLRCRFLVAGRQVAGQYRTLEETSVPSGFEDMFTSIPESCFRQDVSSTELRQTSHPGGR